MSLRTLFAVALLGCALHAAPLSSPVASNTTGLALGVGVAGIAVDADFGLIFFVNPRLAVDAAATIAPGTFDDWTARGQSIAIPGVDAVGYGFRLGVPVWPSNREN